MKSDSAPRPSLTLVVCEQAPWQPAWVHANFRIGHQNKRQFLVDRFAWQGGQASDYPSCEAPKEKFVAIE